MSTSIPIVTVVDGFIVIRSDGWYLDRYFEWRYWDVPEKAYVHQASSLAQGGLWALRAHQVRAAEYNSKTDSSRIIGEAILFPDFMVDAIRGTLIGKASGGGNDANNS